MIFLNREYTDLISLIAQNREAMTYFKTLPDKIKSELSKQADQIRTIESLKEQAGRLEEKAER